MAGNIITINGSKDLSWYVADSQMKKLVTFLGKIGFRWKGKIKEQEGSKK